ncbi:hypothetical protein [Halocatena marina]|uniref:hypothetical protein n=1 Tax=Halocatena marina TaxID=2934937 RepID=UPI00200E034B|nr:hypothetical protein [Halocatena marina]
MMFDDAHYRWRDEPDDGEYELQFDRFESNKAVLLVVDKTEDWPIGDIVLPATDTPGIDPDNAVRTAIFHGTIDGSELVELVYDPQITEQRIREAEERYERVRATPDDENGTQDVGESENQ